jgi:hypothetical protein
MRNIRARVWTVQMKPLPSADKLIRYLLLLTKNS